MAMQLNAFKGALILPSATTPYNLKSFKLDITHLTPEGFAIPALEGGNCKCRKGGGLGGGQGEQRDEEFLKQARRLSSFRVEEITRTNKILAVS